MQSAIFVQRKKKNIRPGDGDILIFLRLCGQHILLLAQTQAVEKRKPHHIPCQAQGK